MKCAKCDVVFKARDKYNDHLNRSVRLRTPKFLIPQAGLLVQKIVIKSRKKLLRAASLIGYILIQIIYIFDLLMCDC